MIFETREAVILIVPGMLLALLSAAVLASHGQIHTTGTLARASRIDY